MSSENKLVCEHIAATVRCLQGPCVIAGDWNMEPATLSRSGFLAMVNDTIVAPELPTCNGKVYDYFVVTNNFIHAVAGAQRIEGVRIEPHFRARLLLRGDARRFAIRSLSRPKKVPANPDAWAPTATTVIRQCVCTLAHGSVKTRQLGAQCARRPCP